MSFVALHEGRLTVGFSRVASDSGAKSGGRVREWCLGQVLASCLGFLPCHLKPDMRFSLIRLTDNLLLADFKVWRRIFRFGRSTPTRYVLSRAQSHVHSNELLTLSVFLPTVVTVVSHIDPALEIL